MKQGGGIGREEYTQIFHRMSLPAKGGTIRAGTDKFNISDLLRLILKLETVTTSLSSGQPPSMSILIPDSPSKKDTREGGKRQAKNPNVRPDIVTT